MTKYIRFLSSSWIFEAKCGELLLLQKHLFITKKKCLLASIREHEEFVKFENKTFGNFENIVSRQLFSYVGIRKFLARPYNFSLTTNIYMGQCLGQPFAVEVLIVFKKNVVFCRCGFSTLFIPLSIYCVCMNTTFAFTQ